MQKYNIIKVCIAISEKNDQNSDAKVWKIENRTCSFFKLLPLRLICYHFNFAKKVPVKYGIGKCRDITLNTDRWFSKIINQQPVQIL